jgi:4'-phosphopantetheinyl transferase
MNENGKTILKIRAADPALTEQHMLSEREHERLANMHEGARPAFVTARALLRTELGQYMGLMPTAVPLLQKGAGRVAIDGFDPNEPPYFSVSHTGAAESSIASVMVCGDCPVGIDIQQIDFAIDWQRVAARRFPPSAWELLQVMPEEEGQLLFFTLWTIKEAFVKMEDGKLLQYLRGIDLKFENGVFTLAAPTPKGLKSAMIHFSYMPEHQLVIAVVARDEIELELDCEITRISERPNSLSHQPEE